MNPYEQMRNSMKTIHKHLQECLTGGVTVETMMLGIKDEINKALAVPPRNCDVGTAEEQEERRFAFCRKQGETMKMQTKKNANAMSRIEAVKMLLELMRKGLKREEVEAIAIGVRAIVKRVTNSSKNIAKRRERRD